MVAPELVKPIQVHHGEITIKYIKNEIHIIFIINYINGFLQSTGYVQNGGAVTP